ncbi:ABC transporter ATP-binding protein [Blastococcus sp. SYSU DS1021]
MSAPTTDQPYRWENARVLWTFVRPHRRTLLGALVLGFGASAAALATPLVTKQVLDNLGAPQDLLPPIALLLGLLLVGSLLGLSQWTLLGRVAEQIVLDARTSLVRRFFSAVVPTLRERSAGELVTRVTSDTVLLREAASGSLVGIANSAVTLIGAVVLMGVLDLVLLSAVAVGVLVIGIVVALLMPRITEAERSAQASVGRLGGVLETGLRALRTVKSSGAETRESERVITEARASAEHSIRGVRISAIAWTIAGSGIQLVIIGILTLGAWRVSTGALAVSTLVALLLYAFQTVDPISELTMNVTQLQAGMAAAARIREVEDIRIEDVTAGDDVPARTGTTADNGPILTLDGASVTYPGRSRTAVYDLSLTVPRTGHIALVGPSGAGKSTVMSLMLRFIAPDRGSLTMEGVPFDQLSIGAVRSRIAYVEQESPLLTGTVRDNVLFRHPDAADDEAWAALSAVQLSDTVARLDRGLDHPVSDTTLSGGERQRLALARAIVRPPAILLLDEATAQLDGLTEAAIQEVIRQVARHGAVVTIAHRLSTVLDADQIHLMEDGRIRATGTHQELLGADEMYRGLVEALRIAG